MFYIKMFLKILYTSKNDPDLVCQLLFSYYLSIIIYLLIDLINLHPKHDPDLVSKLLCRHATAVELLVRQTSGQLVHLNHVLENMSCSRENEEEK